MNPHTTFVLPPQGNASAEFRHFRSTAAKKKIASNMARSLWKGPFLDQFVLKKLLSADAPAPIKIWSRRSYILPQFVEQTFAIYTGKSFLSVKITEEMIGHKFGEFASTRKKPVHKKKEKKK